jgi:hypothetical protein
VIADESDEHSVGELGDLDDEEGELVAVEADGVAERKE